MATMTDEMLNAIANECSMVMRDDAPPVVRDDENKAEAIRDRVFQMKTMSTDRLKVLLNMRATAKDGRPVPCSHMSKNVLIWNICLLDDDFCNNLSLLREIRNYLRVR
jgi:hypothetical protein